MDEQHVEQKAEGEGIQQIQVVGNENITTTISGTPAQIILKATLSTFLVLQACLLATLVCARGDTSFIRISAGMFCPVLFGIPALYGVILGMMMRDKTLLIISLLTGIGSLLPSLICVSPLLLASTIIAAEKIGLPAFEYFKVTPPP